MWGKIKSIVFVILVILIIIGVYIIAKQIPENEEKITEKIAVNKIVCYSSANAINSGENLKTDWFVDIYQYTDIAIYLHKISDINIEKVYVDNIQIVNKPALGEPQIYQKKIEDYAKNVLLENNEEVLEYNVSEDGENEFKQNCSNPITLSYINRNIKKDFVVKNTGEQLTFDETILKKALILPQDIEAQISFDVNVVDSEEKQYKANVVLDIPVKELMEGQNNVEIAIRDGGFWQF